MKKELPERIMRRFNGIFCGSLIRSAPRAPVYTSQHYTEVDTVLWQYNGSMLGEYQVWSLINHLKNTL